MIQDVWRNHQIVCVLTVNVSAQQELFPANKRSCEHFSKYFTDAGLKELSDFARNQQSIGARKELQKELQEQMSRGDPQKEVRLLSTRINRLVLTVCLDKVQIHL